MAKKAFLREKIKSFPHRPGVYLFKDTKGSVLYIGKALNLNHRATSYLVTKQSTKNKLMLSKAADIQTIETGSELAALLLEAKLIFQKRPKYNIAWKDERSALYVFISIYEKFPVVLLTRKPSIKKTGKKQEYRQLKGIYFGPFVSSKTMRNLLASLRKIFPFCQKIKPGKRACFYSQLHLCSPCPSNIIKTTGKQHQRLKKQYRNQVLAIKKIFQGDFNQVRADLEKIMQRFAKNQQYEQASQVRDQIEKLDYVIQKPYINNFLENPNYYYLQQTQALSELHQLLIPYFPQIEFLRRIECYDVSNIQGNFATGSMVVFINGLAEKKHYRRFKIKSTDKPNDAQMMTEIIERRINQKDWHYPQLIMVDGGKTQIQSARKVLFRDNLSIPVIGLVKNWEKVILVHNDSFITLGIPKSSNCILLLQQIRDEAHRFAIAYHRKLRKKFLTA